jgi:hypothetical protein
MHAPSLAFPSFTRGARHYLIAERPRLRFSEVLWTLPDLQSLPGRCSPLPFFLVCLGAALLCYGNATRASRHWCRYHHALLQRLFGARRFLRPTALPSCTSLPRASDGKTVRGVAIGSQAGPACARLVHTPQPGGALIRRRLGVSFNLTAFSAKVSV